MTTILLADDHSLITEGMNNLLGKHFPNCIIVSFHQPAAVINELAVRQYDLYIIDLEFRNANDMSGFGLISEIRRQQPDARIIVYTMHNEYWTISRLLALDLHGIVLKNASVEPLVDAIKKVLDGERFVCPEFRQVAEEHRAEIQRLSRLNIKLTERERIVLQHIVQGITTLQIADKLCVTVDTIDYHKRNLFSKFGAKNNAELAAKAVQHGWIE